MTYLKHLTGGSGDVHVLQDQKGRLFTFKGAVYPEQMKEEIVTDALYRSLGLNVPVFAVYDHVPDIPEIRETITGPGPYRLAEYIETGDLILHDVCAEK